MFIVHLSILTLDICGSFHAGWHGCLPFSVTIHVDNFIILNVRVLTVSRSFCWNLRKHTMKALGGTPGLVGSSNRSACSKSSPPWRISRRTVVRNNMAYLPSTHFRKPKMRRWGRESQRCFANSSSISTGVTILFSLVSMSQMFLQLFLFQTGPS